MGEAGLQGYLAFAWGRFPVLASRLGPSRNNCQSGKGTSGSKIMQFADASGRNGESTQDKFSVALTGQSTGLTHSPRICVLGCVPQGTEMELNVWDVYWGQPLGSTPMKTKGWKHRGQKERLSHDATPVTVSTNRGALEPE